MDDVSTARSRELGARLRGARKTLGWTGNRLARAIGWSPAKASRLETGNRQADAVDVAYLLGFCHLSQEERDAILELLGDRAPGCWVRPHAGVLPEAVPSVVCQQDLAGSVTVYDPCGIPPLLQTAEYAEADLLPRYATSEEVMPHLRARLDRHGLLHRSKGPGVLVYLHESALRSMPVAEEARAGQLLVMLMLAGQRQRVRLRVVPAGREHTRVAVGAFQLLRFADYPPVVCVPTQTVSLVLEGREHLEVFGRVLAGLDAVALSGADSIELIRELADTALREAPLVGVTEDESELERLIAEQAERGHRREAG